MKGKRHWARRVLCRRDDCGSCSWGIRATPNIVTVIFRFQGGQDLTKGGDIELEEQRIQRTCGVSIPPVYSILRGTASVQWFS